MEITWSEFLDLFGTATAAALIAGAVCPLVGAFLLVRRTGFYGVTLPQFAAAGVVFGFVVLPWWSETVGFGAPDLDAALHDPHAAINYHLAWAATFTFGGLFALLVASRRGRNEVGHVAGAFAIAMAATILFGHFSPRGDAFVYELLRGEILAIGVHELETVAVLYGTILVAIAVFWRDLVLVSYDPEFARVLGKRVALHEGLLAVVTGLAVSIGTLTFGPILLFGLLVLPPLAARSWSRSMGSFLALSSALGLSAAALGLVLSKEMDLPMGPAVVVAASLELLPSALRGLVARGGGGRG